MQINENVEKVNWIMIVTNRNEKNYFTAEVNAVLKKKMRGNFYYFK